MPRLSESMEEGTVVTWLVPDGSPVAQGEEIAEIETDKATLPYEAPESGVLRILVPEGTTLALGQPIGLIDDLAPLPGGQSIAPPGVGAAGVGQVPGPRAPDEEPPTASFEIQPALHEPHTLHASTPPPASEQSPDAAWSPAWGPQPTGRGPAPAEHQAEDEGETTEFDALDLPADDGPPITAARIPVTESPAPTSASAEPAPVTAAPAEPVAAPDAAVAGPAPMPWVDPSFSPKAPAGAGDESAMPDPARRFTPDELIAPATLPPRPPELQAAPSGGQARVPASPVARRLAAELGIDLATIEGTGPEGRVVRADIEAAQATGAARPPKQAGAVPSTASEFTPPVDEQRAAAPIPAAEAPDPVDEPAQEPAPEAASLESDTQDAPVAPDGPPADDPVQADADAPPAEAAESEPPTVQETPEPQPAQVAATTAAHAAPGEEGVTPAPDPATESPISDAAAPDPAPAEDAPAVPAPESEPDAAHAPEPQAEPAPTPAGSDAAEPTALAEHRVMPAAQPGRGKGEPKVVELTRQQQTVARRMAESKATIPDFHTAIEVDAAPMMAMRAELADTRPDLAAPSVNDLLIKATAVALRAFPALNGGYRDGRLELYPRVNVGIAVDADGTLLVPVIHDADTLAVSQIAARTAELVDKARDGSLRPPDIASATFTVSNLGMLGVDAFTAVITPGQSAILTVGSVAERPVVRGGAVVAGLTVRLTLTTDHRAVYGAEAARFLGRIQQLLEHPTGLLV